MFWSSWAVVKEFNTKLQLAVPKVLKYEPIQPVASCYTDCHPLMYWEPDSDIKNIDEK
jgi:hypothetical protein